VSRAAIAKLAPGLNLQIIKYRITAAKDSRQSVIASVPHLSFIDHYRNPAVPVWSENWICLNLHGLPSVARSSVSFRRRVGPCRSRI
jgi:hypothetical protein